MTRVLALTKYGALAASARQRFLQFAPHLAAAGLSLDVAPLVDDRMLAARLAGRRSGMAEILGAYGGRLRRLLGPGAPDVLWVQYELFPYLPWLIERAVLPRGVPLVLDFDDALFHQYDAHRNGAVRALLGRKLDRLAGRADLVICGNAYLEDWARRHAGRTARVPTVVDTAHFAPGAARSGGAVTLGWIGSPSTWAFVRPVLPAIGRLATRHGVTFRSVGGGSGAEGLAHVDAHPWSEVGEVGHLRSMDIGIMPLDDTPFARGKCAYKLIQYMACGLPVVASPVGMNAEVVEHGVNGFLARTEAEWELALATLAGDPALRQRMGAAGRRKVAADFSLDAHGPRVAELLVGVAGGRPAAERGDTFRSERMDTPLRALGHRPP